MIFSINRCFLTTLLNSIDMIILVQFLMSCCGLDYSPKKTLDYLSLTAGIQNVSYYAIFKLSTKLMHGFR